MELSELAIELRARREALRQRYALPTSTHPRTSGTIAFHTETGGLEPQPIRATDTPLTPQYIDSLCGELDL